MLLSKILTTGLNYLVPKSILIANYVALIYFTGSAKTAATKTIHALAMLDMFSKGIMTSVDMGQKCYRYERFT